MKRGHFVGEHQKKLPSKSQSYTVNVREDYKAHNRLRKEKLRKC